MESRIISTKQSTIQLSGVAVLLLHGTKILIAFNLYSQIVFTLAEQSCDIKLTTHKGTLDTAQSLSVQIHGSLPVDAIEVEPLLLAIDTLHIKLLTVPEVRTEVRLRNLVHVISIVRIGHSADIHKRCQYSTRNGSGNPALTIIISRCNFFASCIYL